MSAYLAPSELHEVPIGTRLTDEQQAVVASNLGLVGRVVKPGTPGYEDAFQNGVLGLARAAQKFDPSKGFAFSTYATFWIKRFVQEAGELGSEHGPANYRRAKKNGATLEPLAALDRPVGEDGDALGAFLPATDDVEAEAVRRAGLTELVGLLDRVAKDDIDRQIIAALLERSPPSQREIGERCGMTATAVQFRLLRLRAHARHPVYRKTRAMSVVEAPTPILNGAAPMGEHVCDTCGHTAKNAAGLSIHKGRSHGAANAAPKRESSNEKPVSRKPQERPALDTKTIKASLYDEDDYDPWLVVVGTSDDKGPRIETAVVSTKVDAEQVAALLTSLGHQPRRFRLADGS